MEQLGRTEVAETEARRAYRAAQGRRWYLHNPHGADSLAAATAAADTARQRTAEHLLAVRLEQLHAQDADRTGQTGSVPWADRLSVLAARPLTGDATRMVSA